MYDTIIWFRASSHVINSILFLNCVLYMAIWSTFRLEGDCIALVHSALKKDSSHWFWCKKIWFVSTGYWLVELASSPVVTSDKWPYLLCYYVQHNHARKSQKSIEPTLHWLCVFYLFQELKDVFCQYGAAWKVWKRAHWQSITPSLSMFFVILFVCFVPRTWSYCRTVHILFDF